MVKSETGSGTASQYSVMDEHLGRNFLAMAVHQVIFRIAWIFKTESVIMPAFLDMIADSGLIRGMLPLLNRTGQSLAPLLIADRLAAAPRKSRWMLASTISMSLPFLFLAASIRWCGNQIPLWYSGIFLLTYLIFFCCHGIHETSCSTVQGKLIPPRYRGRLSAVSNMFGSLIAVCLAWWLLGAWLRLDGQQAFFRIFLFVGTVMMCSSAAALLLRETSDERTAALGGDVSRRRLFREARDRIRQDGTLKGLCLTASLFVFSQLLFPHYQRLGMEKPQATPVLLMAWVVAQHLGVAWFSLISGILADRVGTRAALRFLSAAAALAPLTALGLATWVSVEWYCIAFFWIGVIPVTFRMQVNYALEIVPRSQHPAYISTMTLCMAVPFLLSPVIGAMVQQLGFTMPFLMVTAIVGIAALRTWSMPEPRHPEFRTGWKPDQGAMQ